MGIRGSGIGIRGSVHLRANSVRHYEKKHETTICTYFNNIVRLCIQILIKADAKFPFKIEGVDAQRTG